MLKHVFITLALAAAFVAPTTVVATAEERNLAFILASLGFDAAPAGTAVVHVNGEAVEMPIAEALAAAAARAGDADLGALAASAAGGATLLCVGDCWLFDIGSGSCPAPTALGPLPVPFAPIHPQFWLYSGYVGYGEYPGGTGMIIDWTTKSSTGGVYQGGTVHVLGVSDFFCIEFFGLRILFPFVNGAIWWTPA